MTLGGYHGAALHVDLATGAAHRQALPESWLRSVVGGSGLGTLLLLRASPTGVDPLAPEAAFVVALSPLVGTPLTTSAKLAFVAKSPLTGRIGDALASDRFAIELKRCGMDALVLTGRALEWSLLVIEDGAVRLEPAADLKGLSSWAAEEHLRERFGASHRFFGIGPAGENLVRYATLSGDARHAGRGGLGAVLGAKRLKGILVKGTRATPLFDKERVLALAKSVSERSLGPATAKYRELGTVANLLVLNRLGALPTRNFQAGTFEGAAEVSGEAFHATPGKVRKHCAACTIGCEHVFEAKDGAHVRLEYEGLFALGPLIGVDDREVVLQAARLCDDLGLDVISAGGTIAWAMECGEKGLLEDAPRFGDGPGALALLADIAARRGLGALLAEGSREASRRLGRGSERFACHVKGLELPGYDPRALKALAVGLATGSRGADHNKSSAYEEDFRPGSDRLTEDELKGPAAAATETKAAVLDCLILCKFLRGVFTDLMAEGAEMLAAVTGWEVTARELEAVGERVVLLKRLFNEREGWAPAEDTLPERFLSEPLPEGSPSGGAALTRASLERMIRGYYRARGLTEDGWVPRARMDALGLTALLEVPEPA